MEAPKCKICGERHYGVCTVYGTNDAITVSLKPEVKMTKQGKPTSFTEHLSIVEKPKFDRVAYQKAYMKEYHKKRRAALKAAKDKDKLK